MTWSTHDPWEHPGLSVDTATDTRRGVEGRPSLEQTVKRATVTHCLGFNAASGRAWINVEVFVKQFGSIIKRVKAEIHSGYLTFEDITSQT